MSRVETPPLLPSSPEFLGLSQQVQSLLWPVWMTQNLSFISHSRSWCVILALCCLCT